LIFSQRPFQTIGIAFAFFTIRGGLLTG